MQIDIYGPVKCADRNGFEYLFAAICVATGAVFLQPLRAKSDAVNALRAFAKWVALRVDIVETKLLLPRGYIKLGELRMDRGGEFTTTWGATASEFDDVAAELFQGRFFGSPGEPRAATPNVERFWGTLRAATDASMIAAPAVPEQFKYYAMCHAHFVYNRSPTTANKLGNGEAPFTTLGLDTNLERLVPFGTACVVKLPPDSKGTVSNVRGRILGYPPDTGGYIVLLDVDPANPTAPREVVATMDVVPQRAGDVWSTVGGGGDMVKQTIEPTRSPAEYVLLPTPDVARAADVGGARLITAPVVQSVGTAPGDAGSRAALLPFRRRDALRPHRQVLSIDAAIAIIREAARQGQAFSFRQANPKQGASRARYEVYKAATSFAQLAVFRSQRFPDGVRVLIGSCDKRRGDFVHDVRHHFVTFHEATPEPGSVGEAVTSPPLIASPPLPTPLLGTPSPWTGRLRRVRAGAALWGGIDTETPLSAAETQLLTEVRTWSGPAAGASRRRSVGVGSDLPHRLVRAAVATTSGTSTLEDVMHDGLVKVFDVKGGAESFLPRTLPRSFSALRKEPDWASGILPAIKTEIAGLISAKVYDEVPWEPWMRGDIIRTHRLDSVKPDKHKSRFVAQGNLTRGDGVHFDEVATSMAAQTSVKMVVALAAGLGYGLYSIDFRQAFLQADVANPNLFIDLPELPVEMEGGEFGTGKGKGMVGRLNKALYGLCDSPRLWALHLRKFLSSEVVGVRILSTDRNVFQWSFEGETLTGCVHVDDVLFAPSGDKIRLEFLRRIRLHYEITGGDALVTKFCGYEFRYDSHRQTITMHQESFARSVLAKYDMLDVKPADTPMRVGDTPLIPWLGTATDRQTFDFAMFMGDLTWLTRTNPRLAFVAQDLSRFVTNPGPDHIAAARRVLAHLKGNPGRGLTFHGSDTVLNESYPHRNTIIAMVDSGFSHKGDKAVSGVTVLMNGAAIVHISRRQATVSNTSTEAEVKAVALAAEVLASVVPLWSELAGARHPAVRCMVDNKGAKKQVESGTDSVASAPYLRSKAYAEGKIYAGIMWMDLVPGEENGADMATKQVRDTTEFLKKDGIISGSAPFLYTSAEVVRMMMRCSALREGG